VALSHKHGASGNPKFPRSFLSNIKVINANVYTNHSGQYSVIKIVYNTVRSESRCAFVKGAEFVFHDPSDSILARCYLTREEVQFFSDRFMHCCKPDIFLLSQLPAMILMDTAA
jgi:hypothetical protein